MLIIDRFENGYALIETPGGLISLPAAELPPEAREGDVLRIVVDPDATRAREAEMRKRLDALFQKRGEM